LVFGSRGKQTQSRETRGRKLSSERGKPEKLEDRAGKVKLENEKKSKTVKKEKTDHEQQIGRSVFVG